MAKKNDLWGTLLVIAVEKIVEKSPEIMEVVMEKAPVVIKTVGDVASDVIEKAPDALKEVGNVAKGFLSDAYNFINGEDNTNNNQQVEPKILIGQGGENE